MTEPPGVAALEELASAHGIDITYEDAFGASRRAGAETLVRLLAALGVPIGSAAEAEAVLDGERGQARRGETSLPPVVVAWDGELPPIPLGPQDARAGIGIEVALEDGGDPGSLVGLAVTGGATVAMAAAPLPFGVHELAVSRAPGARRPGGPGGADGGWPEEITVISAPHRSTPFVPDAFGVLAPVYALHEGDGRQGDLSRLEHFGLAVARLGASYVATLPILAELSRRDDPAGRPAPYSPVSRLFWNEGYLDASRVPELAANGSEGELDSPRSALPAPFDAGRRAAELRPVLEAADADVRRRGGEGLTGYEAFVAGRPDVIGYARFRAACELHGADWTRWPASARHGVIGDSDVDRGAVGAHVFAQFAMDRQLGEVASHLRQAGAGLLLDLPVGCSQGGYEPWAFPESYAAGASVGAPPDLFFSEGQDWGFRPLDPEGERRSGYAVTAAALRHLLRHSAALRLDHAMSLSRLWWIPEGMAPSEGAYVRYRLEEMVALCCLEASRRDAALVGEDLGTVERSLTETLADHGISGMHVAVFDLEADAHPMEPLRPRPGSVASVDTHDTATFAEWFSGADVERRVELGLTSEEAAVDERMERGRSRLALVDRLVASDLLVPELAADPVAVHAGLLGELGQSEAALVVVNPEDCWAEADPQNVPGTTTEHVNFARRFALTTGELAEDDRLRAALGGLAAARAAARRSKGAVPALDAPFDEGSDVAGGRKDDPGTTGGASGPAVGHERAG